MRLIDFGVAMVAGSREFTRTGNTPGSPAFMSPEQLRGERVGPAVDYYALGAVAHHAATGQHLADAPQALRARRGLTRALVATILALLDPVPALRRAKYWSPVGRVDNVHGDRNLVCACPPVVTATPYFRPISRDAR